MDTAGPWGVDELFELQRTLCDELVNAKRELATLEQTEMRCRYETFRHLNDGTRNITTIREEVTYAAMGFAIEQVAVRGDIDGLEGQLRWVEMRLDYLTVLANNDTGAGDDE